MKKNDKMFCYWVNSCGKYTCCHNCLSKNCIYRCTDNLSSCKYKCEIDRAEKARSQAFSKHDVDFNIVDNKVKHNREITEINNAAPVSDLDTYQKKTIDKLPSTLDEFSSMIRQLYKLKKKDADTIYCIDLYKHCDVNNLNTIYGVSYIDLNSKLRKIRKMVKTK